MKTGVTLAALMITSGVFAQKIKEQDLPTQVSTSFQKKYSNAIHVKWSREGEKFESEFNLGKEELSVVMDVWGNVLETEIEINAGDLPKSVSGYIKSNYKQRIKEAAKITDDKGVVTYEAEIKGKDLIFDSSGAFVKETKK